MLNTLVISAPLTKQTCGISGLLQRRLYHHLSRLRPHSAALYLLSSVFWYGYQKLNLVAEPTAISWLLGFYLVIDKFIVNDFVYAGFTGGRSP